MEPWHKYYPEGKSPQINFNQYQNLGEVLSVSAGKFGSQPACENYDKQLTYSELEKLSNEFGTYLLNNGLKKGDRIAIQMPNLLQYLVVLFGSLKAGLVVVNTNPLYTPREMQHQFKDSGATAIVILANFVHNLEKVIESTEIKTVIISEIGDLLGGIKGTIVNLVVKHIKKMVPSYNLPGHLKLKKVMNEASNLTIDFPQIDQEDLAFLQYTGGTTGVSKGAMLSHGNVISNLMQVECLIESLIPSGSITVTPLPLYHIFALTNSLGYVKLGLNNLLITNPKDLPAFIKELKKHPFANLIGVNTLFNAMINREDFKSVDFSSMKLAVGGGMAVQKYVSEKWEEITGAPLIEGYGLTEASPVLTINPLDGENHRIGSIGIPIPETDIEIWSEDKKPVPVGEIGEIVAKGKQVMKGYWQRPEATAEVMTGEWLHTGDMGIMDEDGFLKIVDRKKEMILVSGFNVYPNEIENVVASHPKVLEVGAIGVPDKQSTEVVKIFVVKSDQSLTSDELQSYCRENLTAYKCPKHIEFIDELPKSNVGKVLRRILKENDAEVNSYN